MYSHIIFKISLLSENDFQHAPLYKAFRKPGAVARSDVPASTLYADGRVFDYHVRQHSFVEIGHEIFSTAVLSLPLIQLLTKGSG